MPDRVSLEDRLGFSVPPYRLDYETINTDYRIGLLGLHWVMQIMHLPAYRSAKFRLTAACDNVEKRIHETLAKGYSFDHIDRDWQRFIKRDDVDIVDCTFGHNKDKQHKRLEVVEAAAANGKHLMIHKPVAVTLALAEQMAQVAADGGIHLAVNQDCRYNPACYSIKQLLTPVRLGTPKIIELQHYWTGSVDTLKKDRAAWVAHTVHHADLIKWWVGAPCVSVYARTNYLSTLSIYEFANGTIAYHMENHAGVQAHETKIRIMAENGIINAGHNWNWHLATAENHDFVEIFRDPHGEGIRLPLPTHTYEPPWSGINPWIPQDGPYYHLAAPNAGMMGTMASLMHGVETGLKPDNSVEGAIDSLRMCLAGEISGKTGAAVNPADVPSDTTSQG